MKWARGLRAFSITEQMQRWLQQQYCRTLIDEEFNASHTASVIALVWSNATKAAVKNEQEWSLKSPSAKAIYLRYQNWKLKAGSCQVDWGVERETSHGPPRCQAFRKPPLHRCQLQGGVCPSPPVILPATEGSAELKRSLKHAKGCESTCTEMVPLASAGTRGRWLGNQVRRRERWALGVIIPHLLYLLLVVLGCSLLVYFIMVQHIASYLGMVLYFAMCVKARQKRDCHPEMPWKLSSSNNI